MIILRFPEPKLVGFPANAATAAGGLALTTGRADGKLTNAAETEDSIIPEFPSL